MFHTPIANPMIKTAPAYGRLLRIGLGLFLLALFGYVLLSGALFGRNPTGRINAELVTLRAPIDGVVLFGDARVGDNVTRGQMLGSMRDPPERNVRLADLKAQHNGLAERIAGLQRQIASLEPILERLTAESRDFRGAVIRNLNAQIAEAEARVKRAEANVRLLDSQYKRIQTLAAKSYASTAELDRRRSEAEAARAELAAQKQALERLQQERQSAEKGIFLSDSYNNAPYSQQRRDEVELQLLTLATRKADLEAEYDQVGRQIEAEQLRREQTGQAVLAAPADGVLWRLLESNGATVGTSTPLLQIADCSRIFFEVVRERRTGETPAIGTEMEVAFRDASETVIRKARLVALRGDQDGDRREFAVASPVQPDQLRWVFAVDFSDEEVSTGKCPIGRTGELRDGGTAFGGLLSRIGLGAR